MSAMVFWTCAEAVGTLELTEAPEKVTRASNQLVKKKKYVVPARLEQCVTVMPFAGPYGCEDMAHFSAKMKELTSKQKQQPTEQ